MRNTRLLAILFAGMSLSATAQDLNSAYYTDGYLYRHDMNPAIGNDETTYVSIPVLGNLSASMQGNFGYENILHKNPNYGKSSDKKLVTFMSPYITTEEALKGFSKGNNKLAADVKLALVSVGFKGFGGYNTIEMNARAQVGANAPYELFEFARNIGNKSYDIGEVNANAQSFAEIALGHSHKIGDNVSVGVKAKLLLGVEDVNLAMKDIKADLSSEDKWIVSADAQLDASMKGLKYESETRNYESKPGTYQKIKDVDVDDPGISGVGFAVDLGIDWKINDCWRASAAILDLGSISWNNNMQAVNRSKSFVFDGFHDITVDDDKPGSLNTQTDEYDDQISDFLNLMDNGDQGKRSTGIGTTLNAGVEYTLPTYRKLSFSLLGTARMRDKYSWNEARLSANWAPAKWFSGGVNVAAGTFGTSAGWIVNLHPKGFNLFVGMDRFIGKVSKEYIPLKSNASLNMGMNIEF